MEPFTLEWWLAKKKAAYKRAFEYEDEWEWALEYHPENKEYYWQERLRYTELMIWIGTRIIDKYGEQNN